MDLPSEERPDPSCVMAGSFLLYNLMEDHMKIIRAALVACAITASMLGAATPAEASPALANGPCLFGHVDPNNDNSACRGSNSANFPESDTRPDGTPSLSCSRLNEGQNVRTRDAHGWLYWGCKAFRDQWGNVTYEWTEFVLD